MLTAAARSSQIAFSLRAIQSHLIASVSVDGAHDTRLDREVVVQSLSHRCQTVGCAGCSGDDGIFVGKGLMVYIVNDGRQIVAAGAEITTCLAPASI